MSTLSNYLAVQDANGSPSNEWEARFSESLGNNANFLIYGTEFPTKTQVNVNYLDVKDAFGTTDNLWFVNTTSVNSGNNSQIYFNTPSIANVQIYGAASVVSGSERQRLSSGSFNVTGNIVASANAIRYANAIINGYGFVVASAGKQSFGFGSIVGNGNMSAIGKINGEEWQNNAIESESWTNESPSSTIWTNKTTGNSTWQ